ncbi:SCO2322 family protein, partial [Nonomuraea zeae]
MLRAYRVAAAVAVGAACSISLPLSALAAPSPGARSTVLSAPAPGAALPGAADPGATRAWSVWQSDGTAWLAGTPQDNPSDGSVIGWRFSAAPDAAAGESPGGDLPSFQTVCGKDAAASGHKRVVVAVDFGDGESDAYPGDRPPAQGVLRCVAGAEDATAAQLLASAAEVRVNAQGDVVTVSGYPAQEQGGAALTPATPGTGAGSGSGLPIALIAGGAGALALLGGGAVVATRRRTRSTAQP